MMKKVLFLGILTLCICAIAMIFACESVSRNNSNFEGSINVVNVAPRALIAPDGLDPAAQTVARGANDFAFRLGSLLLKNTGNENFVFSPFSVWLPLAAISNATMLEYKPALLTALGAAGINEADINRAASRMLYSLTKLQNKDYGQYYNPLQIANAIFVGDHVTLKEDFAQTFLDYFRGASINVDFSSDNAVNAVNKWASDNTEGLIKEVVQEFDPLTVAAIANAIYFSDRWKWEFNANETKEDVFYSPSGESKASYMIRQGYPQTYYEDNRIQAIPLEFVSGGGLYIILPKTGNAAEFLSSMTNTYFNQIQQNTVQAKGKLLLPRFSIDNKIDGLKDALIALGVPLFDPGTVPLTGGLIEENLELYMSDAIQKALIKVDEKGTTAAAVTVMGISATSMPLEPEISFEMICNKPFVFILYDRTFDGGSQILFTGVLNQPK